MTSEVLTLTRLKWYGMVIGAAGCFFYTLWTSGVHGSDFTAGFLSATLAAPFVLREPQERKESK